MKSRIAALALVAFALPTASAAGHAVVQPSAARPADPQVYRVTIPNESDTATVDVRMRAPAGIDFLILETPPPGWEGEIVREGDRITEVHWSGGEVPPEQFATFRFLARNPVEEGEITWPIVQRYAGGDVQRWIGPPDSDEPASRTQISESATPQDIVSVTGERVAEPAGGGSARPPSTPAKAQDGGRDGLTLGIAVAGLVCGLAALLLALRRRGATAAAILTLAALLAVAPAASAHKGNPNYLSQVNRIVPALTGLTVEVVNRDDRLALHNGSGEDIVIEGYNGEPYARVLSDGTVEVNTQSPAYYLNEDRLGTQSAPAGIDGKDEPVWKQLSKTGRFEWHDHRAHYMGKGMPTQVKDPDVRTKVFDWRVPLQVGSSGGAIAGALFWTPQEGGGVPLGAILIGAALLIAMAVGVLVVRRRRAAGAREGGPAEAW